MFQVAPFFLIPRILFAVVVEDEKWLLTDNLLVWSEIKGNSDLKYEEEKQWIGKRQQKVSLWGRRRERRHKKLKNQA